MHRIDRSRLAGAQFPLACEISTRVGDADMLGHINNVAVIALFQEVRSTLITSAPGLPRNPPLRPVVAGMTVEYVAEMHWPHPVEVLTGVLDLGRTSVTVGQVIRQHGRDAAYAEVAMVMQGEQPRDEIAALVATGFGGAFIRAA